MCLKQLEATRYFISRFRSYGLCHKSLAVPVRPALGCGFAPITDISLAALVQALCVVKLKEPASVQIMALPVQIRIAAVEL